MDDQVVQTSFEAWPCGCTHTYETHGPLTARVETKPCENHILLDIAAMLQEIVKRREEKEDEPAR